MVAEFTIGRGSKASTGEAFKVLAPHPIWKWVGYIGVLTGFLILGYYSVVAGWTLEYTFQALTGGFAGKTSAEFITLFQEFSKDPLRPLLWLVVFLLLTHFVVVKGVEKGIERSSKLLMPLLFILIVLLAICSLTLPGANKGVEFLLKPDFSKVTPDVFLGAMGQAFFSLSLGMGCLSTYASYFGKETRLVHTAASVGLIDTFVAVLAGLVDFHRMRHIATEDVVTFQNQSSTIVGKLPFQRRRHIIEMTEIIDSLHGSGNEIAIQIQLQIRTRLGKGKRIIHLELPGVFLIMERQIMKMVQLLLHTLTGQSHLAVPELADPERNDHPYTELQLVVHVLIPENVFQFRGILIRQLGEIIGHIVTKSQNRIFLLQDINQLPAIRTVRLQGRIAQDNGIRVDRAFLRRHIPIGRIGFVAAYVQLDDVHRIDRIAECRIRE